MNAVKWAKKPKSDWGIEGDMTWIKHYCFPKWKRHYWSLSTKFILPYVSTMCPIYPPTPAPKQDLYSTLGLGCSSNTAFSTESHIICCTFTSFAHSNCRGLTIAIHFKAPNHETNNTMAHLPQEASVEEDLRFAAANIYHLIFCQERET